MTESNEERGRIICISTVKPPAVPSTIVECIECRAPLWRSDHSMAQDLDPVCQHCVPDDTPMMMATPQIIQIANEWGVSALEVANFLTAMGIEVV